MKRLEFIPRASYLQHLCLQKTAETVGKRCFDMGKSPLSQNDQKQFRLHSLLGSWEE